jgi:lysophospholipase L1-like esterase
MTEGNNSIREFLAQQENTGFVNIWNDMLNEHHQPDSSLFIDDMLHMNSDGYKIWQKRIGPELEK